MRKRLLALCIMLSAPLFTVFTINCGGSMKDMMGSGNCASPTVNVTGTWKITETSSLNNCSRPVRLPYEVKITQSDGSLSVSIPSANATLSGQVCADTLTWSGSYPDNAGITLSISSLTATVSADGESLSGSGSWQWSNGIETCAGSTEFTGSKISAE